MESTVVFLHGETQFSLSFRNSEDHIYQQVIRTSNFYEASLLAALSPLLQENDLVLDVGANVGNHSIYFAGVTKCRVFAFEPVDEAFQLLRANVRDNGLIDRVFVRNYALGSCQSHAGIESNDQNNLGATKLRVEENGNIEVKTLDMLREGFGSAIKLIKIDVEGMEPDVLNGARNLLLSDKPLVVCEASTEVEFNRIEQLLKEFGYQATEIFNATPTYLFLPPAWNGQGNLSRQQYFEQVSIRGFRTVRTLSESIRGIQKRLETIEKKVCE